MKEAKKNKVKSPTNYISFANSKSKKQQLIGYLMGDVKSKNPYTLSFADAMVYIMYECQLTKMSGDQYFATNISYLASNWNWAKAKVKSFIEHLSELGYITARRQGHTLCISFKVLADEEVNFEEDGRNKVPEAPEGSDGVALRNELFLQP